MAKKKIYAVRRGMTEGLFETWDECRAAVEGCPGAEYRGFCTREEALAYLGGAVCAGRTAGASNVDACGAGAADVAAGNKIVCDAGAGAAPPGPAPGQVTAYVDGSFDAKLGRYAFGCVLLLPDGETVRESGNGDNPESAALRNVTGEMLGAMFAVKWCEENGYPSVRLCYDYSGIEMWATGRWRTKTDLTRKYADFMRSRSVGITFQKVEAHTGDKYNEEADRLAKVALTEGDGIPKIKKRV